MGEIALIKEAFPQAAGWIIAASIFALVAYRLWASAWDLTGRHARQDAMEKKVERLDVRVRRLTAKDKRRGLKIYLMAKEQEEHAERLEAQSALLREIRDRLIAQGATLPSER
jgi:hypothetical protein